MDVVETEQDRQIGSALTARERVLAAARTLFAAHGVSGTSLQMIADYLGVTKAAVYHQFHAKDDMVMALVERPLKRIVAILEEAEALDTREEQLDLLLGGLVDVVLESPEVVSLIQSDPEAARLAQSREEYRNVAGRLGRLLAGPHPDSTARIASALYGAGLLLIGRHPLLNDIDPATLRRELPLIGRRMLL